MWHSVGLTLLVFVVTLLIVLLLMVCGEWGIRRGPVPHGGAHARAARRLACVVSRLSVLSVVDGPVA